MRRQREIPPPRLAAFPTYPPNKGRIQQRLSCSLSTPSRKPWSCHADSELGLGDVPAASPRLRQPPAHSPGRLCQPPHLVVADRHRGVKEVPDLPQALKTFGLQLQALGIALEDGFVDEETDLLDLGNLQSLSGDPREVGKGRNCHGEQGQQPSVVYCGSSPD